MQKLTSGWYLMYTKPKHEKKVGQRLGELDIPFYLPLIKCLRQCKDRKKMVEQPLFSSYVFVMLRDIHDRYWAQNVEGCINYVCFGGQLARVEQSIIDTIKLAVGSGEQLLVDANNYQPGEVLLIQQGSLAGFQCELIHYKGRQKALVRVRLLNRNLIVDIPLTKVIKPSPWSG